jgi:hypothetical protein
MMYLGACYIAFTCFTGLVSGFGKWGGTFRHLARFSLQSSQHEFLHEKNLHSIVNSAKSVDEVTEWVHSWAEAQAKNGKAIIPEVSCSDRFNFHYSCICFSMIVDGKWC